MHEFIVRISIRCSVPHLVSFFVRTLANIVVREAFFKTSPPIRTDFLFLFLHMHRGGYYVGLEGYTCIPETVTISAVLAGG